MKMKKLPLPDPGEVPVKQAKLLGSVSLLGGTQEGRAMGRGKLCVLASLGYLGPLSCACQHTGTSCSFPHFCCHTGHCEMVSAFSEGANVHLVLWISECFEMKPTANQT